MTADQLNNRHPFALKKIISGGQTSVDRAALDFTIWESNWAGAGTARVWIPSWSRPSVGDGDEGGESAVDFMGMCFR
jgi:hypothetical protein